LNTLMKMRHKLFATGGTLQVLKKYGIPSRQRKKIQTKESPNIEEHLSNKQLDIVINIPRNLSPQEITDGNIIRRKAIDTNIPSITNKQIAKLVIESLERYSIETLEVKSWDEYVK